MNIIENNLCRFCNSFEETITHTFVQCQYSKILWEEVKNWVRSTTNITFDISEKTLILGLHPNLGLCMLFLMVKLYIYKSLVKNNSLNFKALQNLIQKIFEEQKYLSLISHTNEKFTKRWSLINLLIHIT